MPETEPFPRIEERACEDRISSLSNDLLIDILLLVPTKDAVATTVLSKRWQHLWTMLPRLDYKDTSKKSKSVWWFLDESMRLYDGPLLQSLKIKLGPQCPVDVNVVHWVAKALDCRVRDLEFNLLWKSEPVRMPKSLYTCETLTKLILSDKILVDVPSSGYLPSLTQLALDSVVYKDEGSHVRLLSSCPVLEVLTVIRQEYVDDNVRNFTVKVPSLLRFTYLNTIFGEDDDDSDRSLVIDTPALTYCHIRDSLGHDCSVEYMPRLKKASISVEFYPDNNFQRSLSSVEYLKLSSVDTMFPWCDGVNYSRVIECTISDFDPDCCESLVALLSNCPQLKAFLVDSTSLKIDRSENHVPVLWDPPSSVPKCLSSHLNKFMWKGYAGRDDEQELVRYILQNSTCLQTATISPSSAYNAEEKQKLIGELMSMPRVSTSSQLLICDKMRFLF